MASPDTPIISIRGLVNRFGSQVVHDGLDLDIQRGEVLGIVGGSGAGKSVLLRTMLGLHRPSAGQILYEGTDILSMGHDQWQQLQRRWGVLFQNSALFSSLSVLDNVAFPLSEFTTLDPGEREAVARLKMHLAGLPPVAANRFPSELSGGMKKRAALARALALDPPLLFLDEPTSGLDPISARAFDRLIRYLQRQLGLTVVMITHDLDSLYGICDRIAVLVDRRIIVDSLEGLLANPHPWIQEYFHASSRLDRTHEERA
ncbi:MAG: ATP-binding cassette domain-containing protein [Gammaproteobacteria bacterium]|nr:MAG: ATP-binding cassette domain-containing protein [Gammaproteobacteria bacterium]